MGPSGSVSLLLSFKTHLISLDGGSRQRLTCHDRPARHPAENAADSGLPQVRRRPAGEVRGHKSEVGSGRSAGVRPAGVRRESTERHQQRLCMGKGAQTGPEVCVVPGPAGRQVRGTPEDATTARQHRHGHRPPPPPSAAAHSQNSAHRNGDRSIRRSSMAGLTVSISPNSSRLSPSKSHSISCCSERRSPVERAARAGHHHHHFTA